VAQAVSLNELEEGRSEGDGYWRWAVCWLMFASTALCYMDRQAMALVGVKISEEFHLGEEDFGWVMAAFQLTYALFQVPAGFVADRRDVRWTYAMAVVWWSLAGMASAIAPGLGALLACRALLGIGEAFNWPCALRVTGAILPPADRSLGNGIFNSGAAVGAVLTPLIVPSLAEWYGWRTTFAGIGALGFLWVIAWFVLMRKAESGTFAIKEEIETDLAVARSGLPATVWISYAGLAVVSLSIGLLAFWVGGKAAWWGIALLMIGLLVVSRVLPAAKLRGASWAASLGELTRLRRFWTMVVVSIGINVCWHFLVNWLPTYLRKDRGMTFLASGFATAIPFLAADFGNLAGGWISRQLARGGMTASRARIIVMAVCAILIGFGAGMGAVPAGSNVLAIGLLCVMALGASAFMANYFAFCQEVSPRHTGLVVGILGGLGNLFAAGFLPFAGRVKERTGGFGPVFVIAALLPLVGLLVLVRGWDAGLSKSDPA